MPYHQSMLGTKLLCGLAVMMAGQSLLPNFSSHAAEPAPTTPMVQNVVYVFRNSGADNAVSFTVKNSEMPVSISGANSPMGATIVVSFALKPNAVEIGQPVKQNPLESDWPLTRSVMMIAGLAGLAAARRLR